MLEVTSCSEKFDENGSELFPAGRECSIITTTHIKENNLQMQKHLLRCFSVSVHPISVLFDQTVRLSILAVAMVTLLSLPYRERERESEEVRGSVPSESDLAEDFVVGVQREGGGERPDVGDERSVLERRRGGRQEGQLAHFAVGRGGRVVGAVGGAGGVLL